MSGPGRLLGAFLAALALCAGPAAAPAPAQETVDVCAGQAIPAGYMVIAAYRARHCPGFMESNAANSLRIRLPVDSVSACTGFPNSPPGWVVVAVYRTRDCPGFFDTNEGNAAHWRVPGDTVSACARPAPRLDGYLVVGSYRSRSCPGFFDSSAGNVITYRRVSPPAPGGTLAPLDRYERFVLRILADAVEEERLGAPTHRTWTGELRTGQEASTALELGGDERYVLIAACDQDCGLLRVTAVSGASRIEGEAGTDGYAVVRIPGTGAARWQLRLHLARCAADPCHFGLGVYRAGQLPRRPPRDAPDPPGRQPASPPE